MKIAGIPEPIRKYGALGLVILVGLLLLLWPKGGGEPPRTVMGTGPPESLQLSEILSGIEGVGRADVLLTFKDGAVCQGALVVCDGADNAGVHSTVLEAIASLTGLRADSITVAKRAAGRR